MMQKVHNAYVNRETRNAARNEREDLFNEMKPLLGLLITEVTGSASLREKRAVYSGIKMKALTIINAHNKNPNNVVRFKPDYLDRMIKAFICDHHTSNDPYKRAAVKGLMPLYPFKFRIQCWLRRLIA